MNKLALRLPKMSKLPIPKGLQLKANQLLFKAEERSPELLLAGGIILGVGATVMACKATLKVEGVLDTYHKNLDNINMVMSPENRDKFENYSEEDAKRDKFVNFVQTMCKLGKLYAPAIGLGVMAISCVLGSYHIMNQRQIALNAAYLAVKKAYDDYRERVKEEIGEEAEDDLFHGVKKVTTEEVIKNRKGEEKVVKKDVLTVNGAGYSPYARFFDEASIYFRKDQGLNKLFLIQAQSQMNDLLKLRGHVFLNEVYDALDIPHSREGAVVGWKLGNGDNYIDFGIWDPYKEGSRRFVNEFERAILLDFNVDGVIYDLI